MRLSMDSIRFSRCIVTCRKLTKTRLPDSRKFWFDRRPAATAGQKPLRKKLRIQIRYVLSTRAG
ncbi:hypothetical protein A2379_05230 [Candidatus Amesbacteria bacterium RIFOXYB1_FULL_47_13]|nr:MAG: hypothetical protein A2379_05230 [Candidatus Amesbacteria bacterium RIFOXYB1_FULL_47_13]